MAKPLTVIIQSLGGYEVKLSVDCSIASSSGVGASCEGATHAERQIRGEIVKAGIPERLQILGHDSKVLNTDEHFNAGIEGDEATTLENLLSGLGDDVCDNPDFVGGEA